MSQDRIEIDQTFHNYADNNLDCYYTESQHLALSIEMMVTFTESFTCLLEQVTSLVSFEIIRNWSTHSG